MTSTTTTSSSTESTAPTKVSLVDFYGALTMPEEDAVEKYFDDTLEGLQLDIPAKGGTKWSRAVVFVFKMRSGLSPLEAHAAVSAMTRTELLDAGDLYLLDDEEEATEKALNFDPEDPQTPLDEPASPDA